MCSVGVWCVCVCLSLYEWNENESNDPKRIIIHVGNHTHSALASTDTASPNCYIFSFYRLREIHPNRNRFRRRHRRIFAMSHRLTLYCWWTMNRHHSSTICCAFSDHLRQCLLRRHSPLNCGAVSISIWFRFSWCPSDWRPPVNSNER